MERWENGRHYLELELPDIMHCHVIGPVAVEEAKETMRVIDGELFGNRGLRVYFVAHLEEGASLPSETRKYFGTLQPTYKASIAVGGSNPLIRAATNTALRAMNILSGNKIPFKMVRTMDDARAFIEQLRKAEAANHAKVAS